MIGFFLFLCSIDLLPHYSFVILTLIVLFVHRKTTVLNKMNAKFVLNLLLISAIVVLSFINSLIHINQLDSYFQLFPYTSLMFCSLIIAQYLTEKDIKVLIILIVIEAVTCLIEFTLKMNTLFIWKDYYENYNNINTYNLFYFSATNGLSSNSSVIAIKILSAFLLMFYFKPFKTKTSLLLKILLFGGLLAAFQRTSIAVLFIFLGLYYIQRTKNILFRNQIKFNKKMLLAFFVIVLIIGGAIYKAPFFYKQFAKGQEKIELSGRETIWNKYINFIDNNVWFGNYSQKLYVTYKDKEVPDTHAHNSYLQVFATHGLPILLLFIVLIIINLKAYNRIYIISFLTASLFQYALFWGVSFVDIMFFVFTLKLPSKNCFTVKNIQ